MDLSWGLTLVPNAGRWAHTSPPRVYAHAGGDVLVAVFAPEGIVLKRLRTQ